MHHLLTPQSIFGQFRQIHPDYITILSEVVSALERQFVLKCGCGCMCICFVRSLQIKHFHNDNLPLTRTLFLLLWSSYIIWSLQRGREVMQEVCVKMKRESLFGWTYAFLAWCAFDRRRQHDTYVMHSHTLDMSDIMWVIVCDMYTGWVAHPKRHGSAVGQKERADLVHLSAGKVRKVKFKLKQDQSEGEWVSLVSL